MKKGSEDRKIAIISTSEVIGIGLVHAIDELAGAKICVVAPEAMDLGILWEREQFDVVLISIEMVERFGQKIKELEPLPRVLVFAPNGHAPRDLECAESCACGYVSLDTPMERLKPFVEFVARCPLRNARYAQCALCPAQTTLGAPELPITSREREVFELISCHQGSQDIAEHLGISVKTVESHRASIKKKLECETNSELIETAAMWRRGIS